MVDEGPFPTAMEAGHLIHAKSQLNGRPVEWLIALYIHQSYIVQVLAFGTAHGLSEVEPEVRGIVTSLAL